MASAPSSPPSTGCTSAAGRRWWMAELVPELATLPPGLVLDGELVAWGDDGLPSFPRLCDRILHRRRGIPVSYIVFDVLEVEGHPTLRQPFRERRARSSMRSSSTRPPSSVEQPLPARRARLGEGEEPETPGGWATSASSRSGRGNSTSRFD
jgi:hypothetical protein